MELVVKSAELIQAENDKYFKVWACIAGTATNKKDKTDYRTQVFRWCEFLNVQVGTNEAAQAIISATSIHARAYRDLLENLPGQASRDGDPIRSAKSAPATVRKKMAVLRSIYRDLMESGLSPSNPFLSSLMPSVDYQKRPTEMLPFSKVWEVINAPGSANHLKNHKYPADCDRIVRDRAMLAVMFAGALRRSEVVKIQINDLKTTEEGTTYLLLRDTKCNGDRNQVVASWASEFVWIWHARRVSKGAQANDYLFCPLWRYGIQHLPDQISTVSFYLWVKEYFEVVGLDPKIYSPHSARATAVTRLLDQGVPHREVQEFSRHSSIQMVERYDKRRFGLNDNPGNILEFPKKTGT
jgi:site-specific recombinase XerD